MNMKLATERSKAIHQKTTFRAEAGGGSARLAEGEWRTRVEARACFGRVTLAHVQRDARARTRNPDGVHPALA